MFQESPELASVGKSFIVQEFIPHEEFLKIFVIGKEIFVFKRKVERMKDGEITRPKISCVSAREVVLSNDLSRRLQMIATSISSIFKFELFGFDVIESGEQLFVVDVNYFPTFKELGGEKFRQLLDQYCKYLVRDSN